MSVIDYFKSTVYFYYLNLLKDPNNAELKTRIFYNFYSDKSLIDSITTDQVFSSLIDIYYAISQESTTENIIDWLLLSPKELNEQQWLIVSLYAEMFAPLKDDCSKNELFKYLLHRIQFEFNADDYNLLNVKYSELKNIKTPIRYIKLCIEKTRLSEFCKDDSNQWYFELDPLITAYYDYVKCFVNQKKLDISELAQNHPLNHLFSGTFYTCPTVCNNFVDLNVIPEDFFIGYTFLKEYRNYKKAIAKDEHATSLKPSAREAYEFCIQKLNCPIKPFDKQSFKYGFKEIEQLDFMI